MNKTNFTNLFGTSKTVSIIILIIAIVVIILTVRQYTGANADRICSRSVLSETQCSNGSWSGWSAISGNAEQRTYTGTRGVQRTIQFRTSVHNYSCSIGGGSVTLISQVSACQIVETRATASGDGGTESSTGDSTSTSEVTVNESISPTSTTVVTTVELGKIESEFMCSLNQEDWRGCDDLKVSKKSTPIYLKSFADDATSWNWSIGDNGVKPLSDGQSIGVFNDPKTETTRINLEYGGGNVFTKDVTLEASGKDEFGFSGSGSVTKTLNITVVDITFTEI